MKIQIMKVIFILILESRCQDQIQTDTVSTGNENSETVLTNNEIPGTNVNFDTLPDVVITVSSKPTTTRNSAASQTTRTTPQPSDKSSGNSIPPSTNSPDKMHYIKMIGLYILVVLAVGLALGLIYNLYQKSKKT